MIFHVSISADDPYRVAHTLAELWSGRALPFPALGKGSWVAMAGDNRNSFIEVLPRGLEMVPGPGDSPVVERMNPAASRAGPFHVAIATQLTEAAVLAIAAREGWTAKYCKRGGQNRSDGTGFGVIELWVENCFMIEVLTAEMQQQYLESTSIPAWEAMLAAMEPRAVAA